MNCSQNDKSLYFLNNPKNSARDKTWKQIFLLIFFSHFHFSLFSTSQEYLWVLRNEKRRKNYSLDNTIFRYRLQAFHRLSSISIIMIVNYLHSDGIFSNTFHYLDFSCWWLLVFHSNLTTMIFNHKIDICESKKLKNWKAIKFSSVFHFKTFRPAFFILCLLSSFRPHGLHSQHRW